MNYGGPGYAGAQYNGSHMQRQGAQFSMQDPYDMGLQHGAMQQGAQFVMQNPYQMSQQQSAMHQGSFQGMTAVQGGVLITRIDPSGYRPPSTPHPRAPPVYQTPIHSLFS